MSRARKSQVAGWHPDPRSPKPLYRQVYERLRQAIHSGTLQPGERLPSTRSLASQLSAARGTVDLAYNLLATEGYVVGRGAAGTFVAPGLTTALRPSLNRSHGAAAGARVQPRAPGRAIDPFQMGAPALDAFPHALWCRLTARRARNLTMETMATYTSAGYAPLRDAIVSYLTVSRGIRCHADQVIITTGFQGALGLVTRAFLQPGDEVWFEEPGYPFARDALEAAARMVETIAHTPGCFRVVM